MRGNLKTNTKRNNINSKENTHRYQSMTRELDKWYRGTQKTQYIIMRTHRIGIIQTIEDQISITEKMMHIDIKDRMKNT
jgi:hypothetical protein